MDEAEEIGGAGHSFSRLLFLKLVASRATSRTREQQGFADSFHSALCVQSGS